jgi:hypothetical protein
LKCIESDSNLMADNNTFSVFNSKNKKEPKSCDSINDIENWKGLISTYIVKKVMYKQKKNKRKTKYMESTKKLIVYCL